MKRTLVDLVLGGASVEFGPRLYGDDSSLTHMLGAGSDYFFSPSFSLNFNTQQYEVPDYGYHRTVEYHAEPGWSVPVYSYPAERPGLQDPQPFQFGYAMPGTGTELHIHGPNIDTISYGTIEDFNKEVLRSINGEDASIAVYGAELLGLRRFPY